MLSKESQAANIVDVHPDCLTDRQTVRYVVIGNASGENGGSDGGLGSGST